MSPVEMRRVAAKLRKSIEPPHTNQPISRYYASMAIHALASAITEIADEDDPQPVPAFPPLDIQAETERMTKLRREIDEARS